MRPFAGSTAATCSKRLLLTYWNSFSGYEMSEQEIWSKTAHLHSHERSSVGFHKSYSHKVIGYLLIAVVSAAVNLFPRFPEFGTYGNTRINVPDAHEPKSRQDDEEANLEWVCLILVAA